MAKKQVVALRAKTTMALPGGRFVVEGQVIRSDDPVVKGNEELFESVNDQLGIEQATAAPGERRNVSISADNVCDECGFESKSAAGLAVHQRSHEGGD